MRLNTILWFYLLFMEIFYFRTGYNLGGKGKWPSRENWMWRSSRGRWSWTSCQRARTRVLCPRDFLEAVCWVLLRLLGMLESAGSWNWMGSELDLDQRKDLDCCQLHLWDIQDLQGEGSTCFPDCKEIERLRNWFYAFNTHIWIFLRSLIHRVHDRGQKETNNRDIDAWSGAGGSGGGYTGVSDTARSPVPREQYSCDQIRT